MDIRQSLVDRFCDDGLLFADGYDAAILGVAYRDHVHVVVYDTDKIISTLMADMSREDAIEYFEFNVEGAYVGERTPIYVRTDF